MIYSNTKKTVIYCPFKNCSSSLQAYFSNKPQWHSCVGPNPDYNFHTNARINRHTAYVPQDVSDNFLRFLPIRNPYDRVISQYHWHLKTVGEISFNEWLMVHSKQPVCQPVTTIYEEYDHLLHVENMEEEMREHGLLIVREGVELKFPRMNVTEDKEEIVLTSWQKEYIYFLHYSDFVEGGYSRNLD